MRLALSATAARVGGLARRLVPLALWRRTMPGGLVSFMYHTVSARPLPHVAPLYPHKSPEQLEADLRFIRRHLRPISYEEFAESRRRGKTLPRRAALVTFDDGMAQCYTDVRPLLLAHEIPCVFFLTTDFLDNRQMFYRHKVSLCIHTLRAAPAGAERRALAERLAPLAATDAEGAGHPRRGSPFAPIAGDDAPRAAERWLLALDHADVATIDAACAALGVDVGAYLRDERPYMTTEQARALAADGFTLGGHSRSHVRLGLLATAAEVEAEIVDSCAAARRIAGGAGTAAHAPFAFPFHGDGVDRATLERVLDAHPYIGTYFDGGALRRDRPYVVHRLNVDRPPGRAGAGSTLPHELRDAYWERARA